MQAKPNVAVVMSQGIYNRMFRDRDMACLREHCNVLERVEASNADALRGTLANADYVLTGWGSPCFNAELLASAPKLKHIAYSAGSVKGIITDAVYDRNITVSTSANGNAVPVAQYTVATIVSLLKQVPWLAEAYKANDKDEVNRRKALVRELEDLTIAIIGASRIGREVVRLLKPYPNLTILCYDPYLSDSAAAELGVQKVSLEEACRCEVVSIHAPAIPETRHMFNARTLALLPDHAVLINTSRGHLLDEAALVAEVQKRPLYVLLDVTQPEPPTPDSPLRREKNILITPHIAGAMNQSCKTMGQMAIQEIIRHSKGEKLAYTITREMFATQA